MAMESASNQENKSISLTVSSSLTGVETFQSDAGTHSASAAADHGPELASAASRLAGSQPGAAVRARNPSVELSEVIAGYGDAHEKQSPVISMTVKDPLQPKLAFMQSYVYSLLPELKRIHSQPPPFSLKEKLSAVRLAADTSLAVSSAGNSQWSQALLQHLAGYSRSKARLKGEGRCRKTSVQRRRIYERILRRSSARGSLGLSDLRHGRASPPCVCMRAAGRESHHVASLMGRSGMAVLKQAHRAKSARRKRSGLSGYVRALRRSIYPRKMMKMEAPSALRRVASVSKEHIESLSRLVPGGGSMDVPILFEEAADYIRSLQMQVEALQCLSQLISL